jgi:hypothetical protein
MSPILFNIVADMLALLINRAKEDAWTNKRSYSSSCRRWLIDSPMCG